MSVDNKQQAIKGIALAEHVSYIQDAKLVSDSPPVSVLSHLKKLYQSRLKQQMFFITAISIPQG